MAGIKEKTCLTSQESHKMILNLLHFLQKEKYILAAKSTLYYKY